MMLAARPTAAYGRRSIASAASQPVTQYRERKRIRGSEMHGKGHTGHERRSTYAREKTWWTHNTDFALLSRTQVKEEERSSQHIDTPP